jgi:hypothetical protein
VNIEEKVVTMEVAQGGVQLRTLVLMVLLSETWLTELVKL